MSQITDEEVRKLVSNWVIGFNVMQSSIFRRTPP